MYARTSADWQRERRERRRKARLLPPGIAADIAKVRREDIANEAIAFVMARIEMIAKAKGQMAVKQGPEQMTRMPFVPPVVEREILRELDGNQTFRRELRGFIRRALREAHTGKLAVDSPWFAPRRQMKGWELRDGILVVESDLGLETASALEAEPEGWDYYVLDQLVSSDDGDEGLPEAVRVAVVGAGAGGFARAVTSSNATGITVVHSDWVLEPRSDLACLGRADHGSFDSFVAVLPSPSVGAASNHRGIYAGKSAAVYDPASLGPGRWLGTACGVFQTAYDGLKDGGMVYTLLPASIRVGEGYVDAPDLLDAVVTELPRFGFGVVQRVEVVEVSPVNQPFVAARRPKRVMLMLRKAGRQS